MLEWYLLLMQYNQDDKIRVHSQMFLDSLSAYTYFWHLLYKWRQPFTQRVNLFRQEYIKAPHSFHQICRFFFPLIITGNAEKWKIQLTTFLISVLVYSLQNKTKKLTTSKISSVTTCNICSKLSNCVPTRLHCMTKSMQLVTLLQSATNEKYRFSI